jgi:hypothetical protein
MNIARTDINQLLGRITHVPFWIIDICFTLSSAMLIASVLGIGFLNSPNLPTGGDSASHLLYAWLYSDALLFSGHITPWLPEVFGGFPFLSYYFPMAFIVIAILSKPLSFAVAYKWGAFLAAMLLPGAVFVGSRRLLNLSGLASLFGALGSMAFLLHEQNSIWGGNLLSTLAGEFSYSYGLLFAVMAMMAWSRAASLGKGWVMAGILEAACGFSHGFPLLVVGFSSAFLLLNISHFRQNFGLLVKGHLLAFCLLGGWLWPMIEMHSLTIPNDAAFPLSSWRDLLPPTLWPFLACGLIGLFLLFVPAVWRSWKKEQSQAAHLFVGGAGLSAVAFIAGDQMGLADIRFFPLVWLLGAIVCGWLAGQALSCLGNDSTPLLKLTRGLITTASCLALIGWFGQNIQAAPDWALWNHSGLEAKPQWNNLENLIPAMRGDLWSPRLVFEHDPANNDIGSTRTLEALPMFLNHRPVLEGLYMESAVLGPAIYQLQSEVSTHPSSPLVRFPSGSIDPQFAAQHMNSLHANTLLLRSREAQAAIERSGLFVKTAESLPFAVYQLMHFDSHLAEVISKPVRVLPLQDWMQDSFAWFRTRSKFEAYQPVYGVQDTLPATIGTVYPAVKEKLLERDNLVFETEALGKPHLIKIAYHPRWHLVSKGSMTIAAPGFMMVIPEEKEIHLVYGHTLVGQLGMFATTGTVLFLIFFSTKKLLQRTSPSGSEETETTIPSPLFKRLWPTFAAWIILAAIGMRFALHSPEKVYNSAWDNMHTNNYAKASELFSEAYKLRRPPAKKEEALFWLAKSSELAGHRSEAIAHYRELCEHYHGYWLPESLYTLVTLERLERHAAETVPYLNRLREEYPNNSWTLKLASK